MSEYNLEHSAAYSESGLWAHIKKYAKKAGETLIENVLILYYALPTASAADKAIIIGALGYFIAPIDIMPDALPIVGFSDDFSVVALAVAKVRLSAPQSAIDNAKRKVTEWFA